MCGIYGVVTSSPAEASRFDAEAARLALAHRGPDDSGRFDGEAAGAHCTLVHTRLSIIDLSPGGHQPMPSGDGRYQVVFNGELYNHAEVRRELEALGVRFRSSSDTEVLVEAYARWGAAAIDRFRGMFAFAIWDTRLGTLFLARDRLGIKPLYLAELRGGGLAFASELRALLAAGAAPRKLSRDGLRSYLTWGSVAEPLTMIEGVRTLLPGTHATWQRGELCEKAYWQLRPGPTVELSFDEAVERVRPVLREAVKLRLVSDVPVGVFLSGGIDSSVLATLASQASGGRVQAFTVAFDERELSEAEHAAELARELGCPHHVLLLRHTDALAELDQALASLDQPSADGVNTYFVSKAVRGAGIKVALSGLGGDELFAGYGYFRQFETSLRLAGCAPAGLARVLESPALLRLFGESPARAAKLGALLGGKRGPAGAYAALRCMFTPTQVDSLLAPGLRAGTEAAASDLSQGLTRADESRAYDPVGLLSALELSGYLRNTLLRDADAMSMAHALEVRVPLLDHRLVELVVPLSGRVKLRSGVSKPLLAAAVPELPDAVRTRSKRGFVLPFEAWMRGPMSGTLSAMIEGASPLDEVVDRSTLRRLLAGFHAGRTSASRLWCVAVLLEWSRRHGVGA
mgnify:CR=1 FL=1